MPRKQKSTFEVSRSKIKVPVQTRLWGISAGRCELCNRPLYSDLTFGIDGNYAEVAHIYAVSSGGPRHQNTMTDEEINNISNLMLLCEEHHHMIDSQPENFAGSVLIDRKREHECRIREATEISDKQSCRMVTFFSNIDLNENFSSEQLLKQAVRSLQMFPKQHPVIDLSKDSRTRYEPTKENMIQRSEDLETQVRIWLEQIIRSEDAIAVFALAPQPLLIKLGTLINDQQNTYVFQCHRTGHKWAWGLESVPVVFQSIQSYQNSREKIALVFDLSAEIQDQRIIDVLDKNCSIYHLSITAPNRDFVTSIGIQDAFARELRNILERIKNDNPAAECIHIFPAMPNSLAVRMGMDFMPKADLPWVIYEQAGANTGFIETITIGG